MSSNLWSSTWWTRGAGGVLRKSLGKPSAASEQLGHTDEDCNVLQGQIGHREFEDGGVRTAVEQILAKCHREFQSSQHMCENLLHRKQLIDRLRSSSGRLTEISKMKYVGEVVGMNLLGVADRGTNPGQRPLVQLPLSRRT